MKSDATCVDAIPIFGVSEAIRSTDRPGTPAFQMIGGCVNTALHNNREINLLAFFLWGNMPARELPFSATIPGSVPNQTIENPFT